MEDNTRATAHKRKPGRSATVADDVILQNVQDFDLLDDRGGILPLSDTVWSRVEEDKLSIPTIQSYFSQNRKGICDKLRSIKHACSQEEKNEQLGLPDRTAVWLDNEGNLHSALVFKIFIPKEKSVEIKPTEKVYKDGKVYRMLQGPWTEFISHAIWTAQKITCSWSFKGNRISPNSKTQYLSIRGNCTDPECGVSIKGICVREPDFNEGFSLDIFTYDVRDIVHTKKQQCRGQARNIMKKDIANKKPGEIVEDQAATMMKCGDPETPLIRNKKTYGKMLEEIRAANVDVENPNNILKSLMTKVSLDNCIRSFSTVDFYMDYWTDDQLLLWRTAYKMNYRSVSIDASGRFVKKINYEGIESGHIFLYVINIRINGQIAPLAQMLSSRHHAYFIERWLKAWLACDIPEPDQVTTDNSGALRYGVCSAINKLTYSENGRNNLQFLLNIIDILPPCLFRLDIAHVMHASSSWKCFENMLPIIKELYLKGIGFMSTLKNLNLFIQVLTALFVISESQYSNDQVLKYRRWIITKLETYSLDELQDSIDGEEESQDEMSLPNDVDENENVKETSADTDAFINSIYEKAVKNIATSGSDNCYHCPGFADSMKILCKHFTAWTALMVPFYQSATDVATSTGSENYFRFLRQIRQFSEPQSIIFFYENHLRSIIGRTNLTQAYLIQLEAQNSKNFMVATPEDLHSSAVCEDRLIPASESFQNDKVVSGLNRGIHVRPQPNLSVIHRILENNQKKRISKSRNPVVNASLSGPIVANGKNVFIRTTESYDTVFELFAYAYALCPNLRSYVDKVLKTVKNLFFQAVYDFCTGNKKSFKQQRANILCNIDQREGDVITCTQDFDTLTCKLMYNIPNLLSTQTCESCQISKTLMAFSINSVDMIQKSVYQDLCVSDDNFCPTCKNFLLQNNVIEGFFILTYMNVTLRLKLEKLEGHLIVNNKNFILVGSVGKLSKDSNYNVFCRSVNGRWSRHDSIDLKFKKVSASNVEVNIYVLLYVETT